MNKNFWKGKKVIVTGAAGFIGSHMVEALCEEGAVVTAVVSNNTPDGKINEILKNSLKIVKIKRADLLDFTSCKRILKNQDIVFNFAALDGSRTYKSEHSAEIFRSNIQIVSNILESARINNLDRVLLISSIEIYRKDDNDGYIHSKKFTEIAGKLFQNEYGMKIAIARLGNVYGPRDSAKEKGRVVPTFIARTLQNEDLTIWGKESQKTGFIFVSDLTQALMDLSENYSVCDPVDIVGSSAISILDLAKKVSNLTHSSSKITFKEIESSQKTGKKITNLKAKRVIHFKEKFSLEEGLKNTIIYYKENNA